MVETRTRARLTAMKPPSFGPIILGIPGQSVPAMRGPRAGESLQEFMHRAYGDATVLIPSRVCLDDVAAIAPSDDYGTLVLPYVYAPR